MSGSTPAFCALIDAMVDFGADKLEKLSGDLAARLGPGIWSAGILAAAR